MIDAGSAGPRGAAVGTLLAFGRGAYGLASAAIPDFGMALLYAGLWIAPRVFGVGRINDALLALALEIVAVFAAGLFALTLTADRTPFGVGRATVLTLGCGGATALLLYVSIDRGAFWPVIGFWTLTGNRIAGWWRAPDQRSRRAGVISWVLSPLFYVGAILATTYVPLPPLGLTPQVRIDAGLVGTSLWDTDPQRGLAAGMLYYTVQALYRRARRLQDWLSLDQASGVSV